MKSWHILKKLHRLNVELTPINNCTKFYLFCINNDKVTVCVCGGGGGGGGDQPSTPSLIVLKKSPGKRGLKKIHSTLTSI